MRQIEVHHLQHSEDSVTTGGRGGWRCKEKNPKTTQLSHVLVQSGLERFQRGSSSHLCWEVVPVDYGSWDVRVLSIVSRSRVRGRPTGGIVVSFFMSNLQWGCACVYSVCVYTISI